VFGDTIYPLVARRQKSRAQLGARAPNSQNWVPDRYFERRTSLIEDPADGRLPPLTPQGPGATRRARRPPPQPAARPRAGVSDYGPITDRCIHVRLPRPLRRIHERSTGSSQTARQTSSFKWRRSTTREWIPAPTARPATCRPAIRQYLGDSPRPLGRRHASRRHTRELPRFRPARWAATSRFFGRAPQRFTERFTRVSDDTLALRVHGGRSPRSLDTARGPRRSTGRRRAAGQNLRIRLPRRETTSLRGDTLRRARPRKRPPRAAR